MFMLFFLSQYLAQCLTHSKYFKHICLIEMHPLLVLRQWPESVVWLLFKDLPATLTQ